MLVMLSTDKRLRRWSANLLEEFENRSPCIERYAAFSTCELRSVSTA